MKKKFRFVLLLLTFVSLVKIIPVNSTKVNSSYNFKIYPSGQSCGVKIHTDGILVIAITNIDDNLLGLASPSKSAGILPGDFIKKANNEILKNSEHFIEVVRNNKGKKLTLEIERNNETLTKIVKPVKSSDGNYVIGMWVRDSTAGLGTLTFYTEDKKSFAALGHSITDVDTGEIMNVKYGELAKSHIISIDKGTKGNAGGLSGYFEEKNEKIGTIYKNTGFGLFGKIDDTSIIPDVKPISIGTQQDIKIGKAEIISTISGDTPEKFEIYIEKINYQKTPDIKSMVIKVTDKKLLDKTGGIIQGMSGSPIIQNGKLVGAVTHVFVNDPTRGYGIFIENMLTEAEKIK